MASSGPRHARPIGVVRNLVFLRGGKAMGWFQRHAVLLSPSSRRPSWRRSTGSSARPRRRRQEKILVGLTGYVVFFDKGEIDLRPWLTTRRKPWSHSAST